MTRIRAFWVGVVASTVGAASSLLVASPALADPDRVCYSNEFCVYKDSDFSQSNSMYRFTTSYLSWYNNASEIFEEDSSWRNLRTWAAETYTSAAYFGAEICVDGGYQVSYYYWANDDGASHWLYDGEAC